MQPVGETMGRFGRFASVEFDHRSRLCLRERLELLHGIFLPEHEDARGDARGGGETGDVLHEARCRAALRGELDDV